MTMAEMKMSNAKAPAGRGAVSGSTWKTRALARALLGAALLGLVLAGWRGEARAQDASQAACEFMEIKASSGGEGVDPALKGLASKLKKPPFSSWKRFELAARHSRTLKLMKAEDVPLKMGGKLGALFRQHSKTSGKKDRLSLSLTLDDKSGKRALDTKVHVDSGDYFLIVVDQSAGSGHILAFSCTVR